MLEKRLEERTLLTELRLSLFKVFWPGVKFDWRIRQEHLSGVCNPQYPDINVKVVSKFLYPTLLLSYQIMQQHKTFIQS